MCVRRRSGGTAYWELIKAVFLDDGGGHVLVRDRDHVVKAQLHGGEPQVIYQAGEAGKNKKHSAKGEYDNPRYDGKGVVDATRANKYFTLGLVRKPCDMLLSKFGQRNNYKPTKISDRPALREFVFEQFNSSDELGDSPPMNEVTHGGLMSDMVAARYGNGMIHCMARTHELRGDFEACLRRYARCGGYVNPNHTYPTYLDEALERSADNAHAGGRSVGDHASCDSVFDAELANEVMQHAKIAAYRGDYGLDDQCC